MALEKQPTPRKTIENFELDLKRTLKLPMPQQKLQC